MPDGPIARLLQRIAFETALWYGAAGLFLGVYVWHIGAPAASIAPHLYIVTLYFLAIAFARLVLAATGLPPLVVRAASALLFVTGLALLVTYYGVALAGLKSWGRVPTLELVVSYLPQVSLLLDALGFSAIAAIAIVLAACAAMAGGAWFYARKLDWVTLAASRTSRLPLGLAAAGMICVVLLSLQRFLVLPPMQQQEPISLMFYPLDAIVWNQSHGIDKAVAARRDAVEDAARAAYRPLQDAKPRNVILIVADALRADHMGIYGYPRDTTPYLASLKAAGRVRMANPVQAACGESACGLLSLASSRYVHQFSRRMFVLNEVLGRHGYRTAMILGGDHSHFYGLKEQYGRVDSYVDASGTNTRYMNDDQFVVERVTALPEWDGKPVMLQLHLMSSHMLGTRPEVFVPAANYFFRTNRTEGGKPAPKAINFYDNGVRGVDTVIMAILGALQSKGYLGEAIVAITADHGEGLGEHGIWGHQEGVYREMLGIPFVLISYGRDSGRALDAHPLPSQVDIAPTLLEELGMPRPSSWSGQPLQQAKLDDYAYFEQGATVGFLDRRDIRNPWKYWEDRDGAAFAFNIGTDPGETRNAISNVPLALKREWQLKLLPVKAHLVRDSSRQ